MKVDKKKRKKGYGVVRRGIEKTNEPVNRRNEGVEAPRKEKRGGCSESAWSV